MTKQQLITATEAAEILGIHRSLVWKYMRNGRLKAIQVGNFWLVSQREVRRFAKRPRPVGNPAFKKNEK